MKQRMLHFREGVNAQKGFRTEVKIMLGFIQLLAGQSPKQLVVAARRMQNLMRRRTASSVIGWLVLMVVLIIAGIIIGVLGLAASTAAGVLG